jgi:hypothetical protein
MERKQRKKKPMKHCASERGWYGDTGDVLVFVPDDIYQKHLQAYFAGRGVPMRSDEEIALEAETAWNQQWMIREAFARKVSYWLMCRDCPPSDSEERTCAIRLELHEEEHVK